ncbi:hypothetical protein CEXT_338871 [Caerostris extrusa]|uniref:Uncharacterized protein n=1 Tax=Caerostris extrusa TaxID=172846 RepID=A0AAV4XKY9_CAEEX|nr:hypothetical protein CEXT_338871 [Caerostris extrusa]
MNVLSCQNVNPFPYIASFYVGQEKKILDYDNVLSLKNNIKDTKLSDARKRCRMHGREESVDSLKIPINYRSDCWEKLQSQV